MQAESLGWMVAFAAGLLSFLSPCVLPLVPSYASFITGMTVDELRDAGSPRARGAVMLHGLLFVLGFTGVFLALGASATFLGSLLAFASRGVQVVGGMLLIAFGLYLAGWLRLPGADREWRLHLANKPTGYLGTVLVGVTFGAGWTPCIGPVLGGILTLAATRASLGQGMSLLAVYALGLAVPFLASTLVINRFFDAFARFRRWLPWVNRANGAILLVLGLLMVTGRFTLLTAALARMTPDVLLQRL